MVAVGIILGVVLIFGILLMAVSYDDIPDSFREPTQKQRDEFKGFIDDEHF